MPRWVNPLTASLRGLPIAGAARGDRVRRRLGTLYERLGAEKKQPRSVPIAVGYLVVAAGVLTVAVLA